MKEPRKLRPVSIEGPWRFVPVEEWAERHRRAGHHPHPAPTDENPERWDCGCGGVNRILTGEQIRRKFAHLRHISPRSGPSKKRRTKRSRRGRPTETETQVRPPEHEVAISHLTARAQRLAA